MHAPTAIASPEDAARAVVATAEKKDVKPTILTCWLGADAVQAARRVFGKAGVPTYETPGHAVRAFLHMVRYRHNQEMLMETPPSAPTEFTPVTATARRVVENALGEGHELLNEPESKAVLAAYGVPVVETHIASTPADAMRHAAELGFPVAVKILSPDISHKSDVGGVVLDLETPEAVETAAQEMVTRVAAFQPEARTTGFTVQRMARRPSAHELIVGITTDPIFGPVILFGEGGTAVEVIADRAVGLPPLNMTLARELISHTRVSKLLAGYRDRPAADFDTLCLALMQVSQLIVDIPEVTELDINPLFSDEDGVLALDARIGIARAEAPGSTRLAIRPYPKELEETVSLRSGRVLLLRPIRPEDEPEHKELLSRLSPDDIRFRFFGSVREMPHSEMARFTQIDYDREMAFIAKPADAKNGGETLGVVRTVTDPDNERAEFAIVVRSDLKGQGLGRALLEKMIRYCHSRGTGEVIGEVLPANKAMLSLACSLGFASRVIAEGEAVEVRLDLRDGD
jgi:acetyltransferase